MPGAGPRVSGWLLVGPALALVILLAPLFLIGGGTGADQEQGRLCRMLLPALVPEQEGIRVLGTARGPGSSMALDFKAGPEPTRMRRLTCRFGGIGYSAAKRDLITVTLDGEALGEAALYFLKQGWLESAEAITADPGAPRGAAMLALPRGAALALQHLVGGLPRLGILALLALATALIYGLIGRINLAFGEFAASGGITASLAIAALALTVTENPLLVAPLAVFAALATGAGHGWVMGRAVLVPLSRQSGQPLIVAGVGLLVAVQEGLRLAQGTGTRWLPPVAGEPIRLAVAPDFEVLAQPRLLGTALIAALVVLAVLGLMRASRFGRAWRASADDPFAASLCGIDPRGLLVATSALATALAALAGAIITLNYGGMNFAGGTMIGLTALIAAILGGIGSLGGAVAGAIAIGLFQIGWSALQPIAHWELATFALLTIALVLKPEGLLGHAAGPERKAGP